MLKECSKHGITLHYHTKDNRFRCSKCSIEYVTKRRRVVKLKAIEYLGGKCIKCGYSRCPDAFDFHHRNPTEKDINFGSGKVVGWERIKIELDKCDLLCATCHREEHSIYDFSA